MATGVVRFYNPAKGFGLITPDLGGPAVFASQSSIVGGKALKVSQRVKYDVANGPAGEAAMNIRTLP